MNGYFKKIESYISNDINGLLENFPKNIFHYTNADGIVGILSSHTIWATNIGYLNDSSELTYARDVIVDNIRKYKSNKVKSGYAVFLDRLIDLIESIENTHTNFFIACFCEEGDLLSQWRAYGTEGEGYSIGVYTNLIGIGPELNVGPREFDIQPVVYDRAMQDQLVCNLLGFATQYKFSKSEIEKNNDFYEDLANEFMNYLLNYLVIFKNPCFSEEKEWRIIAIKDNEKVKFRTSNNIIIPYVELDLSVRAEDGSGALPIGNIYIGPSGNKERAKNSIEFMCEKYKHGDYDIIFSKIPLVK